MGCEYAYELLASDIKNYCTQHYTFSHYHTDEIVGLYDGLHANDICRATYVIFAEFMWGSSDFPASARHAYLFVSTLSPYRGHGDAPVSGILACLEYPDILITNVLRMVHNEWLDCSLALVPIIGTARLQNPSVYIVEDETADHLNLEDVL